MAYVKKKKTQRQMKLLFFFLAMFTGCRRGELIALQWPDIDFGACAVHISKSTCRVNGQIIPKTTKTKGSVRIISIPPDYQQLQREPGSR